MSTVIYSDLQMIPKTPQGYFQYTENIENVYIFFSLKGSLNTFLTPSGTVKCQHVAVLISPWQKEMERENKKK